MSYPINLVSADGQEVEHWTLPGHFVTDPEVLACEMERICQAAYELGRSHERDAMHMHLQDRRKLVKGKNTGKCPSGH